MDHDEQNNDNVGSLTQPSFTVFSVHTKSHSKNMSTNSAKIQFLAPVVLPRNNGTENQPLLFQIFGNYNQLLTDQEWLNQDTKMGQERFC